MKWVANKGSFEDNSELCKTGGHQLHVLVKMYVSDDAGCPSRLKLSATLARCGSSLALYQKQLYDTSIAELSTNNKVQANALKRMEAAPKIALASVFAAKRIDLATTDGGVFKEVLEDVVAQAAKPTFWSSPPKLRNLHKYLVQLAILAYNQTLKTGSPLPLLDSPVVDDVSYETPPP